MQEVSLTFEMSLSMSVRFDLISFMKSHRFADVQVTDTKPCKKTRSICRDDEANIASKKVSVCCHIESYPL